MDLKEHNKLPADVFHHNASEEEWITNKEGLKLKTYHWSHSQGKAKGAIVLIHGLASHPLFEWLRHPTCNNNGGTVPDKYQVKYEGSWIQSFHQDGFEVFAIDQQSHGVSDAWQATRCNVERFVNFVDDALQFYHFVHKKLVETHKTQVPIFVAGHSMGGNIVAQSIGRGLHENILCKWTTDSAKMQKDLPCIAGTILLAGAFDLSSVMKEPLNRLLMPFSKPVSFLFPHSKMASKLNNTHFPYTQDLFDMDPLTVTEGKCPSRIARELLNAAEHVHFVTPNITVPVAIWHSIADTYCNVEGAERVLSSLPANPHNQLVHLSKNWHYVMKEPNNITLCEDIKLWIKGVLTSNPQVTSPLAAATVGVNLRGKKSKAGTVPANKAAPVVPANKAAPVVLGSEMLDDQTTKTVSLERLDSKKTTKEAGENIEKVATTAESQNTAPIKLPC